VTGLFGGTFDPPHNGHVALLQGGEHQLGLGPLLVLVSAHPGHRQVHAPTHARLALAQLAFPGHTVEQDDHPRTIDLLRGRSFEDPIFVVGADEFADFAGWKEPDAVLDLAMLAVGTRPGHPREAQEQLRAGLSRPDRVLFFDIEPNEASSTEVRRRVAAGESIDDLVPAAVAAEIERLGLYRPREADG
jgi:nicotinate-nucleotide adenylyltransferase